MPAATRGPQRLTRDDEPRRAADVVAFGQEVGRALSDGRIVGRAEPFAKVFPSSRAVKRVVGALAWVILEDIALDARIDDAGRLVSETSVRRIAANLGLNKDTVTKHLARLRAHGFVFQEEGREVVSGRWEPCRYVLDPSACVERFTHTPTVSEQQTRRSEPCPKSSDTVAGPVSEATGQGDTGQGGFGQHKEHEDVQEQHVTRAGGRARGFTRFDGEPADGNAETAARSDEAPADAAAAQGNAKPAAACPGHGARGEAAALRDRLLALGVAGHVADDLLARYTVQRIGEAVEVAAAHAERNAAGWIVTALRDDWDLTERLAHVRVLEGRRRAEHAAQSDHELRARAAAVERERAAGWSAAIAAALDDAELDAAIERVTTPAGGVGRRSAPLVRAQLIAWAVHAARRSPERPLAEALRDDWDLSERLACVRAAEARRRAEHAAQSEHELRAQAAAVERERAAGWSAAIAAVLDDTELDAAIERVTTPAGGVGRRSAPLVRAQLIAWAVHAARRSPERPLADVLRGSLADGAAPAPALDGDGDLPPPPPVPGAATAPGDLMERIRTRLSRPP